MKKSTWVKLKTEVYQLIFWAIVFGMVLTSIALFAAPVQQQSQPQVEIFTTEPPAIPDDIIIPDFDIPGSEETVVPGTDIEITPDMLDDLLRDFGFDIEESFPEIESTTSVAETQSNQPVYITVNMPKQQSKDSLGTILIALFIGLLAFGFKSWFDFYLAKRLEIFKRNLDKE